MSLDGQLRDHHPGLHKEDASGGPDGSGRADRRGVPCLAGEVNYFWDPTHEDWIGQKSESGQQATGEKC